MVKKIKKAESPRKSCEKSWRINISFPESSDITKWYREWRQRGLVKSCSDVVAQAFKAYQERLLDFDLKQARLKALRKSVGEGKEGTMDYVE